LIPETPAGPIATPHQNLVRWGSIRRVAYGLTPGSKDVTLSPLDNRRQFHSEERRNVPLISVVRAADQKAAATPSLIQQIGDTPKVTVNQSMAAKVTISADEHSPYQRNRFAAEGDRSMTPVPINFRGEHDSKEFVEATPEEQSEMREDRLFCLDGFRHAMSSGEMTHTPEDCLRDGVQMITIVVDSTNAARLLFIRRSGLPCEFRVSSEASSNDVVGENSDIKQNLVAAGCDPKLINDNWLTNHKRWVVWKLASVERRFSSFLGGQYLTYNHLIMQLRKRFEREIKEGRRPAVRKILNRDVTSSRMMILCVCQVFGSGESKGEDGNESEKDSPRYKLELTDGWYSLQAVLDDPLSGFVHSGRIRVGTKLMISSAVLAGGADGIDPLDEGYTPSHTNCAVGLRLTANATRIAKVCLHAPKEEDMYFQD
jgi:hypothetical protein